MQTTTESIREGMPVLARHEGEWVGVYVDLDAEGNEVRRADSHLTCIFPEDGSADYHQINRYAWDDGTYEENHFPAAYRDGRIWWDTDRIVGSAWELEKDDKRRTVCLTWDRKDLPGVYFYEMIQISDDGTARNRTWHWFKDDRLYKRTVISERRVAGPDEVAGRPASDFERSRVKPA